MTIYNRSPRISLKCVVRRVWPRSSLTEAKGGPIDTRSRDVTDAGLLPGQCVIFHYHVFHSLNFCSTSRHITVYTFLGQCRQNANTVSPFIIYLGSWQSRWQGHYCHGTLTLMLLKVAGDIFPVPVWRALQGRCCGVQ